MSRILIVLERGVRAPLEEQYGHTAWLIRCLQWMQYGVDILLQGDAVLLARSAARLPPLEIAGERLERMPDYATALGALRSQGARIFVRTRDWQRFCPGIDPVDTQAIDGPDAARMMLRYADVWHW